MPFIMQVTVLPSPSLMLLYASVARTTSQRTASNSSTCSKRHYCIYICTHVHSSAYMSAQHVLHSMQSTAYMKQ
jgi:hypothetical protein